MDEIQVRLNKINALWPDRPWLGVEPVRENKRLRYRITMTSRNGHVDTFMSERTAKEILLFLSGISAGIAMVATGRMTRGIWDSVKTYARER
mgnify:FL=1